MKIINLKSKSRFDSTLMQSIFSSSLPELQTVQNPNMEILAATKSCVSIVGLVYLIHFEGTALMY